MAALCRQLFKGMFFGENGIRMRTINAMPDGPKGNASALVEVTAWRRKGDTP